LEGKPVSSQPRPHHKPADSFSPILAPSFDIPSLPEESTEKNNVRHRTLREQQDQIGPSNAIPSFSSPSSLAGANENQAIPNGYPMIVLVLLAVTSITLLSTGFGILIGNVYILPITFSNKLNTLYLLFLFQKPNNMINTVLMLSGLPPDKLSQLTRLVRKFQSCFQDLCVYLFVCVICCEVFKDFIVPS